MSTDSIQRPARVIIPPLVVFKWSQEATDLAVSMWKAKASATEIVAVVNGRFRTDFSRRALISKMNREGHGHAGPALPAELTFDSKGKRRSEPKATPKPKARPKAKAPPKPKPAPRPVVVAKPAPAPRPAVPMALPESFRVVIQDLRISHCRYIAGDPRIDSTACGHPAAMGSSWSRPIATCAPRYHGPAPTDPHLVSSSTGGQREQGLA